MQEEEKENEREREKSNDNIFFNSSYFSFRRLLRTATQLSLSPKKELYKKNLTVNCEVRMKDTSYRVQLALSEVFWRGFDLCFYYISLSLFSLFSIVLAFW